MAPRKPIQCPNCGHEWLPVTVEPKIHLADPHWRRHYNPEPITLCGYVIGTGPYPTPLRVTKYRTRATCKQCEKRVKYLISQHIPWRVAEMDRDEDEKRV